MTSNNFSVAGAYGTDSQNYDGINDMAGNVVALCTLLDIIKSAD